MTKTLAEIWKEWQDFKTNLMAAVKKLPGFIETTENTIKEIGDTAEDAGMIARDAIDMIHTIQTDYENFKKDINKRIDDLLKKKPWWVFWLR